MRYPGACLLSLLALAVICSAQSEKPCVASPAVTLSDVDGVTTKTVSFSGSFGKLTAHVFLADTAEPVPGIAFSQSAIQYADSRTDLLPFARALARAGASSIMLDGTVDWHTPNDEYKRPWNEFNCAARWLLANANLDRERLAIGGPIQFEDQPFYPSGSNPDASSQAWVYVDYGWNDPMAVRATKLMKTPQDQLHMTHLVTHHFHLKEVELAWLMESPSIAKR